MSNISLKKTAKGDMVLLKGNKILCKLGSEDLAALNTELDRFKGDLSTEYYDSFVKIQSSDKKGKCYVLYRRDMFVASEEESVPFYLLLSEDDEDEIENIPKGCWFTLAQLDHALKTLVVPYIAARSSVLVFKQNSTDTVFFEFKQKDKLRKVKKFDMACTELHMALTYRWERDPYRDIDEEMDLEYDDSEYTNMLEVEIPTLELTKLRAMVSKENAKVKPKRSNRQ